jgi:hypothetical protein
VSGGERLQPEPTVYPLPAVDDDPPRFTVGLVLDVARVLAEHGYPPVAAAGADLVELQQALFRFLYVRRTR